MKHGKLLAGAFNGIVIIGIASILAVAIFFLHSNFERGVQFDIFRLRRDIEDSVRRTVNTEYRRYFLLMDIGRSLGDEKNIEEFTAHLENKADIFGPDGDIPHLAVSIGYFNVESPEIAYEYEFASGEWREIDELFSSKPISRDWEWYFSGTGEESENLFLAIGNRRGKRVVFFRLDRSGFIDTYIKDIIKSANSDFVFEWHNSSDPVVAAEFKKQFRAEPDHYRFFPLRIITGIKLEKVPLIIELPGIFDYRKFIDRDVAPPEGEETPNVEGTIIFNSGYFVKMYHKEGSYYHRIEYDSAVNFMETVVIFLIIGVLFMLLLFQLQKTRIMRQKEKEFVASITHELRTPLTVIRSAADNLCTGIVSAEKLPVYGGLITEQSERLGKMIEEILMYSNMEQKKRGPEEPVEVSFPVLLSQLKPALNELSSASGIKIHWDTDGLPESAVSYPEEIAVAVNNLVSNVVSHAYGENKGEIRVVFRHLIPDRIRVTVEDDGRGIEARELKHIFEPFYRDSISRQRYEKGSGLGLFITKRKAALAGGRLTVESPYRRIDGSRPSGCRFTLDLPCIVSGNRLSGTEAFGNGGI